MLNEFKAFLTKSNALALAIGVIIGAATGKVVSAIADDLLMPVVGLLLPGGDWRQARWVLKSMTDAQGKVAENAVLYGHFFASLIDFVIIAFVVFIIARMFIKPAAAPATKTCPACLETIPLAATRCRACTNAV